MKGTKSRPRAGAARRLGAVLTLVGLLMAPASVAMAHNPELAAEVVCVDNRVMIRWMTWAWDRASGNPDIRVFFDGEQVAQGSFTAENSFELSGEAEWPDPQDLTVVVRVEAFANFETGKGLGTGREVTLTLTAAFVEECAGSPTTTSSTTTSTSTSTTTTTQASAPTTASTTTTSAAADVAATVVESTTTSTTVITAEAVTETTVAAIEVAGILVSAPAAVAAVQQDTLPFTGVDAGIAALAASMFGITGLALLAATRPKNEITPDRSWS